MKITFHIQYRTVWGEELQVILNEDEQQTLLLTTQDGIEWQGSYEGTLPAEVTYRYGVYRNGTCIRKELSILPHRFYTGNIQQSHYLVHDCWRDMPEAAHRYSMAFNPSHPLQSPRTLNECVGSCITFRALCPGLVGREQELGIIGSCNALGNWEYCRPIRMQEVAPNVWYLSLDATQLTYPFEYKFVAIHRQTGAVVEWECGENRIFHHPTLLRGETYIEMETEVRLPVSEIRLAGTAIPVFSLRSEGSCGVGDFGDLKELIHWAADTRQRAIQILPINDTTMTGTWTDSYPYSSISIYAFHPMYIDLRQLPALKDWKQAKEFETARIQVNALPQVDYEQANQLKHNYLKAIYLQEGKQMLHTEEFQQFFRENQEWLLPYAAFCYLRNTYHTPDFSQWEDFSAYRQEAVAALCAPESQAYTEIAFHYFTQYILHCQLLSACRLGRQLGVIIKGDIPIGISRTSVEAWVEPHYFHLNGQAGAPPDAFSAQGQNWGMPTYNWEAMAKDGYRWWKRRFQKMAEYFTAYRIDHILGFFRIWEIPIHSVEGLLGQFVPSLPMSREEIQGFGLTFQEEFMTTPFINDAILGELFKEHAAYVRTHFVQHLHDDIYTMRPEFDTQRKVEAFFTNKTDADSLQIKEGLYRLISNVLFVKDRRQTDRFHPRIAAQQDFIYRQLNRQEQEAFNHIHTHYYYHRHNEFWYEEAMKKLPELIRATSMLVCGEDLGMVPDCVPWVMEQLQILSLEIQRMPKHPGDEFGAVGQYPYRSVCTIGTHDMATLRGWWEENLPATQSFYRNELKHEGKAPLSASAALCEEIIRQHLQSPSMLCILTWQDWTSMDETLRNPDIEAERINIPANPRHYWRWRMHLTLEQLKEAQAFNQKIRTLITESNR